MANVEDIKQQLAKAEKQLEKAEAALEAFNEGEDDGLLLKKLRSRELREDVNSKEQAALKRLEGEEARLTKAVETCREVWARGDEDLWQARTQPGKDFVTRHWEHRVVCT